MGEDPPEDAEIMTAKPFDAEDASIPAVTHEKLQERFDKMSKEFPANRSIEGLRELAKGREQRAAVEIHIKVGG